MDLAYNFRGLLHYHLGGKHGGTQADKVLGKDQSLHLYQQAAGREKYWACLEYWKPQSQQAVTHFLQQDHFYSKKAIPYNRTTAPYEPMSVIFTQTTTVSCRI